MYQELFNVSFMFENRKCFLDRLTSVGQYRRGPHGQRREKVSETISVFRAFALNHSYGRDLKVSTMLRIPRIPRVCG